MELSVFTTDEIRRELKSNAKLLDHFVSIIFSERGSADYYFHFGMLCNGLELYEEADRVFEQALEIDPNHSETLFELAEGDDQPTEAISKYRRIIDHDSENAGRAYAKIGYVYKDRLQDPVKAIEAFNKAIELYNPDNHTGREDRMRLDLGLSYLNIGDSASAKEHREYLRGKRSEYALDEYWKIDTELP